MIETCPSPITLTESGQVAGSGWTSRRGQDGVGKTAKEGRCSGSGDGKQFRKIGPGAKQELQEIEHMVAEDRKIQAITEGSAFRYCHFLG